jgi:hypothetical protein
MFLIFMFIIRMMWQFTALTPPIELVSGSFPRRQQRLVEAWAELHQEELMSDWQRLQEGQKPLPIQPLS